MHILFRCLFLLIFCRSFCFAEVPSVLVSVAPHKFFVEQIGANTVQVQLLVPAGASSHTYEPTAKQMIAASKAAIWFQIGESFETRACQALRSHHPELRVVDLRQGVALITAEEGGHCCKCCPGSEDLHFWLSARQAQIQAQTIATALSQAFPEHATLYQTNLLAFQQNLKELDKKIQIILAPLQNRHIFVSHPAYAYFCRDYALKQYSIEVEGKDPTPQQMTKLLNFARKEKMKAIFIQMQYNNKAAKLVAETLGARLVILDPYSEHYMTSMLEIAHAFAGQ